METMVSPWVFPHPTLQCQVWHGACSSSGGWCQARWDRLWNHSQMLHAWYIYPQNWAIFGVNEVNVGKCSIIWSIWDCFTILQRNLPLTSGDFFWDFRSNGTPEDVENGKPMVSPLESDLGMVENRPMPGIFQSDLGHFGEKTAFDISAKTNID